MIVLSKLEIEASIWTDRAKNTEGSCITGTLF